jgi:hypothetical protein
LDGVQGELLIPGARHKQVVRRFELLRAESERPHRAHALVDGEELPSSLVLDEDGAVEETDGEELAVWGPVADAALRSCLGLVDALPVGHPEPEIDAGARGQSGEHRVETESLNLVVVGVLEQALPLCRPYHDGIISTTGGESLTILRVGEAVDGVLVAFDFVLELTCGCSVHEDEVGHTKQNLLAVRPEANGPNLVGLSSLRRRHWNLFLPLN